MKTNPKNLTTESECNSETHYACDEVMKRDGGKALGCCCTNHQCKVSVQNPTKCCNRKSCHSHQDGYIFLRCHYNSDTGKCYGCGRILGEKPSTPSDDCEEKLREEFSNEKKFKFVWEDFTEAKNDISNWWLSKIKEAVAKREGEIVEGISQMIKLYEDLQNVSEPRVGYIMESNVRVLSAAISIVTKKK